jgi:hypothetical protein
MIIIRAKSGNLLVVLLPRIAEHPFETKNNGDRTDACLTEIKKSGKKDGP